MTQTTTSNNQAPPSAGFLFMCKNKFDVVTPLLYYLSHGAQHGAAQIGDNKMANETIFYRAADCNMGDTSEQDCENYRAWAKAEIEAAYPEAAQIEVLNEDRGSTVYTEEDDEECQIMVFLCELLDRCPWSGEYFD